MVAAYGTFHSETGIPYDPLWEGPLKKNRHCTNRLWLTIFSVFLLTWVLIAWHAFSNGNIQKLMIPNDSEGRECGIDPDVKDKPYLVFFDVTKCFNGVCNTPQVCVKDCPATFFIYKSGTTVPELESMKKKLICKIEIDVNQIPDWKSLDTLIAQEKCAKWYLQSDPIINRCIPIGPVPPELNSIISKADMDRASKVILQIADLEKKLENIYHDLVAAKYPVLGFIALSGLAAFLYIILLRWLAKPFVYATIFIICSVLMYFTYISMVKYSATDDSNYLHIFILCIASLIIVVVSTLYLREKIYLACQIIKESSKAVTCICSSLLFPIIPWLLHTVIILLAGSVFLNLQTITVPTYQIQGLDSQCTCPPGLNYINNATCDPNTFATECKDVNGGSCQLAGCYLTSNNIPAESYIFHLINLVALLWLSFFVSAFGQMVLATAFATWYWTFNKRNVPSFTLLKSGWITARYHVGTLAFGAIVMWICDIVRAIVYPFSGGPQNGPISITPGIWIRSLIDSLMRFLQYINRNAYIMCAIHGKGFCKSAMDAFNLITRNVVRVVVTTSVTDWLLRIAKLFIVILFVAITMSHFDKNPIVNDPNVPVVMVLIGSYLITTVIFAVHKAAVDTLFLCFLEDSERNDGSQERPYYMSMKLKQLLER